ncbi:FAD/NAD(P)-binding protein [Aureimonas sp. SK2]|uniref:FAD/NAD(P)-binding protein n=1 Tax=Aureimonas sp. SK2 TaxID=3015992 RepID=UPI0024444EF6|nr:FAD/NAD(P)-binding protein [Aureimonas sp. SK2]
MADHVVVVGGGASGVLMAAHLLRLPGRRFTVMIVEPDEDIGRGLAYGTDDPALLLNTRAGNMSAFEDDPSHFWRWLQESGRSDDVAPDGPFSFAPRLRYREYLRDLLRHWLPETGDGRLRILRDTCTGLSETARGVNAALASGTAQTAALAVLAIGHAPAVGHSPYDHAWASPDELGIRPEEDILILGTGLSMVDKVVALRLRGHRGRIIAVSRRGLLPRVHAPTRPLQLDPADIPFGTGPAYVLRWLRRTVRWAEAQGRDWRDVMDALRPHTAALWQAMPPSGRARFLRHGRTLWDIHRHRMPPELASILEESLADGFLRIEAGRLKDETSKGGRHRAVIHWRGGADETVMVDRVIHCTGLLKPIEADATGLVAELLSTGAARKDALGLGLDVSDGCALIGRAGLPSRRIHAIGPVTKARFWEITAVPDIRAQAHRLAARLAAL